MKKLQRLLATVGLCVLMLLPGAALGGTEILDDQRFVNMEDTFGKTPAEVKKQIGSPHTTGQCTMSTSIDGEPMSFIGKGWFYQIKFNNGGASLSICFIKGYSVSEQRFSVHTNDNGQEAILLLEIFDHHVLRKVLDGELERPSWVDPDGLSI